MTDLGRYQDSLTIQRVTDGGTVAVLRVPYRELISEPGSGPR